jgi:hypothetical protein
MNFYLYIPPSSAHPANMLHSLVYGRLWAYRIRNTDTKDFICMSILLAKRLCNRGNSLKTLLPLFQLAANQLMENDPRALLCCPPNEAREIPTEDQEKTQNPLIFHLKYHPRGITRSNVQSIYETTLGPLILDRRLLVAVSRPKNLGDRVCSNRLKDVPGNITHPTS